MLMGDARQLNKRYGVVRVPSHEATELPAPISKARMARFITEYGERVLREDATHPTATTYSLCEIPSPKSTTGSSSSAMRGTRVEQFITEFLDHQTTEAPKQKSPSMPTKFRWAIRDKDKFESLVADIAYLTAKLNQLVPPKYPFYVQDLSAGMPDIADKDSRDLPSGSDLRRVETILGAPLESYDSFSRSTKYDLEHRKVSLSNRVLNVIWFRMIDDRRDGVREGHATTLDWALRVPEAGASWDDMSQWILSGSGIYWICGKAGSGKSTLMKHLLFHPTVPALLSRWSRGDPCVLGSFFFLNLGHPLQKSQDGLSRAVLYQLLYSLPQLIPDMLPRMWKDVQLLKDGEDLSLATSSEIAHAMKVFAAHHGVRKKFCFFIDSVDELQGDYLEGISFIKQFTANGCAKAIVSSRPIPECMLALKQFPQLKLEDLNRGDISKYVDDTITQHSYMLRLLRKSPKEAAEIVQDLVDKFSGVFLWVVPCRSLISGFADCDRLPELRRRVDELPSELHELFDLMMRRIKGRHKEEGAKLLRMFYVHKQDESQQRSHHPISAISLAQADEDSSEIYRPLTAAERLERCEDAAGRLGSRPGGLLELQIHEHRQRNAVDGTYASVLDFMHRTVFEFLEDPNVWALPSLIVADDTCMETSLISILKLRDCIRLLDHGDNRWQEQTAWSVFSEGLDWGVRADRHWPVKCENIFHEIERFLALPMMKRVPGYNFPRFAFINSHNRREGHSHASLLLAIERGAVNFAIHHPALSDLTRETMFPCSCAPLYRFASPDFLSLSGEAVRRPPHVAVLQALLEAGGNPNFATSPGNSPSCIWLSRMEECWCNLSVDSQLAAVDIMTALLKAEADLSFQGLPITDWSHRIFLSEPRHTSPEIRHKLETLRQVVLDLEEEKLEQ